MKKYVRTGNRNHLVTLNQGQAAGVKQEAL